MIERPRYPRRLIEVDLPIKRISAHARREKSIRHGHISTLHIWWARRPLAACRAVICAALWPDPADPDCPAAFRDHACKEMLAWTSHERQRLLSEESRKRFEDARKKPAMFEDREQLRGALLDFIADFANWDNSTVCEFLETCRALTHAAHKALGGAHGSRPLIVDPFAGGGAIPIEALRVGADAFASDLNPIAVLLNKVVLEFIPKYGKRLADEVEKWGAWIKQEAEKELAEIYPKDPEGATPVSYLWARTVRCEGPTCGIIYPIVGQTWVSRSKNGSEEIHLSVAKKIISVTVNRHKRAQPMGIKTCHGSASTCPDTACQFTMKAAAIQRQLKPRHGGAGDAFLLAVVTRSHDGKTKKARKTLSLDLQAVAIAQTRAAELQKSMSAAPFPTWDSRAFAPGLYGIDTWNDMHTPRQFLALATFAHLIRIAGSEQRADEFSEAVKICLSLVLGRLVDTMASTCRWVPGTEKRGGSFIAAANGGEKHMRWITDFAEANPFSGETGSWDNHLGWVLRVIKHVIESHLPEARAMQSSANECPMPDDSADLLVTDPPYGSAVPYADLSDFFYVWHRRILGDHLVELFSEPLTPKKKEAVVNLRVPGDDRGLKDEKSYHLAMTASLTKARLVTKYDGAAIIVFADKRTSEWEAMLQAVIDAHWVITASWPVHTERPGRTRSLGSASLSSSVHLICRPRENPDGSVRTDEVGDWRDVLANLPLRIHEWMPRLAEEGIVGADAIFACLGPALEIFSSYSRVEKASGDVVSLKDYLVYVWSAVAKEALTMIFTGADASGFEEDARLTAMWLWTLKTSDTNGAESQSDDEEEGDDEEVRAKKVKAGGFVLEYDAARKIAQGLGAHLENLSSLVEVSGETARLMPVAERAAHLFGKDEGKATPVRKKKKPQLDLFKGPHVAEETGPMFGETEVSRLGDTVLDRIHQSMILFAGGRSEALRRFLVDDGAGTDQRFWRLAQALSALYPASTDEKRWVDGVLARKKGLGL